MRVDVNKNVILEEVLVELDQKINYSLSETLYEEREDLKQDIVVKLIEAVNKMEVVSLSTFQDRYENKD